MGKIRKRELICWIGLVLRAVVNVPRDAYATWAAGELVCEHLRKNDNRWPRNWAELAITYGAATKSGPPTRTETNQIGSNTVVNTRVFLPTTFIDISNRAAIDWNADVKSLRKSELPPQGGRPFNVITLKKGGMRSFQGSEPNTMIWEYLQSLKETNSAPAIAAP